MKKKSLELEPLEDRVVISVDSPEEITTGGIVLPGSAQQKQRTGRVIAVGPGRMQDNGVRIPMLTRKGDRVYFAKYAGADVEIDGKPYRVLLEKDVLAKAG
jgi:chaperonin GroES